MLLIVQMVSLIYYHNRINRDLANFLVFLQENDTTLAFSRKRIERSFRGLTYHLDMINQKLQVARMDRERQFHYLQAVVKQVDTGIIAYDETGKIELFNQAAQELLGLHAAAKIDSINNIPDEMAGLLSTGNRITSSPVKIKTHGSERVLAVKSASLRFDDRILRLLSFQNIKPELDAGELDAWRKLIRIQRHEIINSITPITTLTTAINRCFMKDRVQKNLQEITDDHIADALKSVEVIEERSRGLIDFVERFRSLTDVPVLKIENLDIHKLTKQLSTLFSKDLRVKKAKLSVSICPEDLMIAADEKLLKQVLINLVKNSLEALPNKGGVIDISAVEDSHKNRIITVTDNGMGIPKSMLESVFVPSYTTKENGSGIGLSISRQIIQMHNGTLSVRSEPGKETVFEIRLPG